MYLPGDKSISVKVISQKIKTLFKYSQKILAQFSLGSISQTSVTMRLSTAIFSTSCVLLGFAQLSLGQLNACGRPIDPLPTLVCTGCKTVKICIGPTSATEGLCVGGPYCHQNGNAVDCTDEAPPGCEPDIIPGPPPPAPEGEDGDPEEGSILCTGVGIFPDPTDCNVYHYCPARNRFSWVQVCPPDYAFAYTSPAASDRFPCKQIKTEAKDCVKISCSSSGDTLKSYGTSKIFYGICSGEGRVAMVKCSDGATFNGTECVFKCAKEGLYPNTVDPSQYYQCYFAGKTLVVRAKNCPEGRTFDTSLMVCT